MYSALSRRDPNDPPSTCTCPPRGDVSGMLSMLIDPAYAAVPLLLVPTPRCTCTEFRLLARSGKSAK